MRKRIMMVLAVSAVSAVVLAGCSSDDGEASSNERGDSASNSDSTGNGDLAQRLRAAAEDVPADSTYNTAVEMDIQVQDQEVSLDLDGKSNGDGTQSELTMSLPQGDLEMITNDETLYVRRVGAQQWFRAQVSPDVLKNGQTDVNNYLQVLDNVADVEEVGTEAIGGVETTHYSGAIDIRDAMLAGGSTQQQVDDFMEIIEQQNIDINAVVDAFVREGGQLQRLNVEMSSEGSSEFGLNSKMSVDATDEPFDLQIPPDSQVRDADPVENEADMTAFLQEALAS